MGDDEGTRARGVGGRCRSILRAASDALTRCETRLNEVNEKYTFELCPEYRLKVNKTIGTTRSRDDVRRERAGGIEWR